MHPQSKYRIMAFKVWVPDSLRFILLLLFALAFQFSSPTYLSLMGDVVGSEQLYKEDLLFAFQASMLGMTMAFPLLFRFKFRFTSQQTLIGSTLIVLISLLICLHTKSMSVLIIAGFVMGFFKMIGTFECLSSIQLIITPSRDFGVFFSVVYTIVLVCVQLSGFVAVYLSEIADWKLMYYLMAIVLSVQILFGLMLMRPFRFMKPLPLFGIDWLGILNWTVLFAVLTYIFIFGQTLDWFHSKKIILASLLAGIFLLLVLIRTRNKKRAFILPKVFGFRNISISIVLILFLQIFLNTSGSILTPITSAIVKLDDLHSVSLNLYILGGVLVGGIFCYYWFLKINGSFNILFALGFASVTIYHGLLYFSFSALANESIFYFPYFFRGLGNVLIYVGVAKYMMKNVSFELFPQALFIVAIARNVLGGILFSAFIGHWSHDLVLDYISKSASKMDAVSASATVNQIQSVAIKAGASTLEAAQAASGMLSGKVYLQSLLLAGKEIFGMVTMFGILLTFGILLYHFSKPFVLKIPRWNSIFAKMKNKGMIVVEKVE